MTTMYEYTKPRKPIAAMYNSPGPCVYGLPTLVGSQEHDPRSIHQKAPSWMFGVKHGKTVDDASPGPVYNPNVRVTKYGVDGTAKFSLYGRTPDPQSFKTPGPGSYSPEKAGPSAAPNAAKFSFGSRTPYRGVNRNPAPNSYSLPSLLGKTVEGGMRQAPMFTQSGRNNIGGFHEDLHKTPAPCTYDPVDPGKYRKGAPSFGIHSRVPLPAINTDIPGPGAHSPEKVNYHRKSAPAFSFGIRHTSYMTPLIIDWDRS